MYSPIHTKHVRLETISCSYSSSSLARNGCMGVDCAAPHITLFDQPFYPRSAKKTGNTID